MRMNVDDMAAIQQQIARYSYVYDAGDADGWAQLFTEDGIWEYMTADAPEPATRLEGHRSLREFCTKRFASRSDGWTYAHHQSGILFDELSPDSARTRSMVTITLQKPGEPPRLFLTGIYRDKWTKTPGGWRFEHRVLSR